MRRSSIGLLVVVGVVAAGATLRWWFDVPQRNDGSVLAPSTPEIRAASSNEVEWTRVFRDRATARGVDFVHVEGATGRKLLPETLGGGVAIADVDGDGDPDLAFVDGDAWPGDEGRRGRGVVLLLNDGTGTFTTPTGSTGLERPFAGMGIAVGDIDGDRDLDLLATGVSGVRLFRNETDATGPRFVESTGEAGLQAMEGWSTAAGFGDLDADGDLDLVVAHYVEWSPELDEAVDYRLAGLGRAYGPPLGFAGERLRLFLNDGGGRFEERTATAGLDVRNPATGEPMAKALGMLLEDLDDDGDLDLFIANDTVANMLFLNRGDATFEEVGAAAGIAFDRSGAATGAMGVDACRLGGASPMLAIAVGNFANEPTSLYCRPIGEAGPPRFADDSIPLGLSAATRPALTFGLLWADLDGDGVEELVAANGHLEEEISRLQPSQRYRQSAQVFARAGADESRFLPVSAEAIGDLAEPVVGRGLASGDLDLDGDLDLVLTQIGGPPLVLFNESAGEGGVEAPTSPHWIRLVLDGPRGDASVVGAVVVVDAGGRALVRRVAPTRSYLSQVERPLTIGLGGASWIDRLEVRWAGGGRTVVEDLPVDRTIRIDGEGVVADPAPSSPGDA
ncbi:MAG: CRTAC1 family protein [Phycisphaerales bacterium]